MGRRSTWSVVAAATVLAAGCTSTGPTTSPPRAADTSSSPSTPATTSATTPATTPAPTDTSGSAGTGSSAGHTVRIRGTAQLDGVALTAQFLGAVVRADRLVTPCQATIPSVVQGRFEISVFGDDQLAGCGHSGAEIVLWTYQGAQRLFAQHSIQWPSAETADATVTFSTTNPIGAAPASLTELFGEVHNRAGVRLPAGSRVEAYVDNTLCGVASTRSGDFDGYLIDVVGPDTRPGCRLGGDVTFRVDGFAVAETTPHDGRGQRDPFDLTVNTADATTDTT